MVEAAKKGKHFCSRCRSVYNEGTLRFCTDCGGRLVPADAAVETTAPSEGGMFAKILSRQAAEGKPEPEQVPPPTTSSLEAQAPVPTTEAAPVVHSAIEPEVVSSPSLGEPQEVNTPLDRPVTASASNPEAHSDYAPELRSDDGPATDVFEGDATSDASDSESQEAKTADPFIGKKIADRFLVKELLASDADRSTYLADDSSNGKQVLVQTFPAEAFDKRPLKELYADALRKLSRFRDADFASILASGRLPDGGILLVSEFIEGNSLAQIVGFVGHFEAPRAAKLIRKIADALNEAHELGVFHGSLRAENIVLLRPDDPQDSIKIIGLGIAFADGDVLSGGVPSAVEDIYDLAIIAFQLLTGKNPFPGIHGSDVLRSGVEISVCTHRPEIPVEVDEVISRALSPGRENGFADIREFGDAIHDALTGPDEESDIVSRVKTGASVMQPSEDEAAASEEFQDLDRIQVRELGFNEKNSVPATEPAQSRVVDGNGSVGKRLTVMLAIAAVLAVGAAVYFGTTWKFTTKAPSLPPIGAAEQISSDDQPIVPRTLSVPNGYRLLTNSKQGLSTELAKSFIPFTLHYPVNWNRVPSATNFADISLREPDGSTVEHFIVTSYASEGTFALDRGSFPKLVEKSNREVGSLLGNGFRAISQGETSIQGGRLKAYEVKFIFEGVLGGKQTTLWGRRLWIPVQKKGAPHGFVVTLIATPKAPDVTGIDDVGNKGRLKVVLDSFEPLPE